MATANRMPLAALSLFLYKLLIIKNGKRHLIHPSIRPSIHSFICRFIQTLEYISILEFTRKKKRESFQHEQIGKSKLMMDG
jgi:hypothetical protein